MTILAETHAPGVASIEKYQLSSDLLEVSAALARDGGITEETYNRFQFALNTLVNPHDVGHYDVEKENREGKRVTPEQVARFPQDGGYTQDHYFHTYRRYAESWAVNVFDEVGTRQRSCREGVIFQVEFNGDGHLCTLRLFRQVHRDSLFVDTVDIAKLIEQIKTYASEYQTKQQDIARARAESNRRERLRAVIRSFHTRAHGVFDITGGSLDETREYISLGSRYFNAGEGIPGLPALMDVVVTEVNSDGTVNGYIPTSDSLRRNQGIEKPHCDVRNVNPRLLRRKYYH